MRNIQMVDLMGQYDRIKDQIDEAILSVVKSSKYIKGPEVQMFEAELAEFLGVKHVIGCANGTDALQLALMALDLPKGAEVITPNFTYVATVEVVLLLGLKPVLVDVDPDTFNLNPAAVEAAITENTGAIVPVHLFGQSADMEAIMQIADKHELAVVEDNAQAIGADFSFSDGTLRKTGTIGQIGTTSFFPSKNLGCMGDGGAIFTNDDELAKKLRMIANHGQSSLYYFDLVGINSRLDSIQAAILRVKLGYLKEYTAARQKAAATYDALLASIEGVTTPARFDRSTHVFHQYTLKVPAEKRDGLRSHFKELGIPCGVYYPLPMSKHKAYAQHAAGQEFPVADQLCKEVISLPMHTELNTDQQKYIVSELKSFLKR